MGYGCPKDVLAQACELTPGIESPTISPLGKEDWVAVRSLVRSPDVQPIMDQLGEIGCKAILVTRCGACRISAAVTSADRSPNGPTALSR
jgi:ATP phosphoribosyltransferase